MSALVPDYERFYRAQKVSKLTAYLDEVFKSIGLDPVRNPIECARRLKAAAPSFWTDLGKACECKRPPSTITQREVIGHYLDQAASNRRRAS